MKNLIDDGEKKSDDDEGAHAVYCYVGGGEDAHEDERIVVGGLIETKNDE